MTNLKFQNTPHSLVSYKLEITDLFGEPERYKWQIFSTDFQNESEMVYL